MGNGRVLADRHRLRKEVVFFAEAFGVQREKTTRYAKVQAQIRRDEGVQVQAYGRARLHIPVGGVHKGFLGGSARRRNGSYRKGNEAIGALNLSLYHAQ